jgi:hypothetical protein
LADGIALGLTALCRLLAGTSVGKEWSPHQVVAWRADIQKARTFFTRYTGALPWQSGEFNRALILLVGSSPTGFWSFSYAWISHLLIQVFGVAIQNSLHGDSKELPPTTGA